MKNTYKLIVLILFSSLFYLSCDLEENPPFLSEDSVYSDTDGASVALNGIYSAMTNHFYFGHDYHASTLYMSAMFMGKKSSDIPSIVSLKPLPSQNYTTNFWQLSYRTIGRANDMIANVPTDTDNSELNNILGIAYFLRAHAYLHLVRLYGGVPLHTEPATEATLHKERAAVMDVYDLIIADGKKAESLMFETQTGGHPTKYAANMLMAKAYMTMAGNDNSSPYWGMAYDEAIKVYGKYSLVSNYGDLWASESTANNNSESIFEIQFNVENPSKIGRAFTPNNAYDGTGWERFRAYPEVVDAHMARYPGDPRIDFTFTSQYEKYKNGAPTGNFVKVYPATNRTKTNNGFTYIGKYFIKDQTASSDATNFNYVQFRYADLLLMLAEIENELNGPAGAYKYVNEVLARARNTGGTTQPSDWSGLGQEEFRAAIMKEYHFELLAEGQDWYTGHRRGYDFFRTNYIDVHNARNEKGFDPVLPDDPKAMLLPIPSEEINTNQKITGADQNPGY